MVRNDIAALPPSMFHKAYSKAYPESAMAAKGDWSQLLSPSFRYLLGVCSEPKRGIPGRGPLLRAQRRAAGTRRLDFSQSTVDFWCF